MTKKVTESIGNDWRHKVPLLDREIEVIIRPKAGHHAARTVTVSAM